MGQRERERERERDCRALNREQRGEDYEERRDRQIETTKSRGLTEPTELFTKPTQSVANFNGSRFI